MPRVRWVEYKGERWRLSVLATTAGLLPQTLAGRIDRGYAVSRALATGLCTLQEAGRRGARVSPWQ